MYPCFYLSSLLKHSSFKHSMRKKTRDVGVFTLQTLPVSPTAPFLPPSSRYISYFHQKLRVRLCDSLILVPLHSLSFLSVDWQKSVCDFGWLFPSLSPSIPFISLFCNPWQMPKPVLSPGTLQWAGPLHLSPHCEQRNQLCFSLLLTFYAAVATVSKAEDPCKAVRCNS